MGILEIIAATRAIIDLVVEVPGAVEKLLEGIGALIDNWPDGENKETAKEQFASIKQEYSEVA